MSSFKVVRLKINYCQYLPILNCNVHNQGGLLPPPTTKDDHRVVTIMLISISVCLDRLSRCNVSSQKMGIE